MNVSNEIIQKYKNIDFIWTKRVNKTDMGELTIIKNYNFSSFETKYFVIFLEKFDFKYFLFDKYEGGSQSYEPYKVFIHKNKLFCSCIDFFNKNKPNTKLKYCKHCLSIIALFDTYKTESKEKVDVVCTV